MSIFDINNVDNYYREYAESLDITEENGELLLVHVTFKNRVEDIKRDGLIPNSGIFGKFVYAYDARDLYGIERAEALFKREIGAFAYAEYKGSWATVSTGEDPDELDCTVLIPEPVKDVKFAFSIEELYKGLRVNKE